jgi:hypothetical protein
MRLGCGGGCGRGPLAAVRLLPPAGYVRGAPFPWTCRVVAACGLTVLLMDNYTQ